MSPSFPGEGRQSEYPCEERLLSNQQWVATTGPQTAFGLVLLVDFILGAAETSWGYP